MAEYTGNSIVDYLKSKGQDSSYTAREKLAAQYGISGYSGVDTQNTSLLSKMRAGTPAPTPVVPASQAAQGVTAYDVNQYRSNLSTFTANSTPSGVPANSGNPIVAALQPTQTIAPYKAPAPTPAVSPISYTNNGGVPVAGAQPAGAVQPFNAPVAPKPLVTAPAPTVNPPVAQPANPALVVGSPEWSRANSSPYTPTAPVTSPVTRPATPTTGAGVPSTGTPTPAQPTGTSSTPTSPTDDLARRAGEAGLSLAEYTTLMESRNTVTQQESDAIAKELGITALEGELFKKPAQSSQSMFDTAYQTAGLGNIKSKVDAVLEKADRIRADSLAAISEVDENPFLTEKSRVGRGKRILDRAQGEVDNLMKQVEELNSVYKSGVDEINGMVTRNTYDFGVNQQIDQAKLNYLIKKAESQTKRKGEEKGKLTDSQIGGYLAGRKSTVVAKKPETIGSPETGFYRWDETLQKFLQVIPPSAQTGLENDKLRKEIASVDTATSFKPSADQKALVGRFLSTADGRSLTGGLSMTDADLTELMKDSASFYAVLQKANEAGIY